MTPETQNANDKALNPEDVQFNAHAIAGAWDATDELPACVAAAIAREFTDHDVSAADGEATDGDVHFPDAELMVEEKAIGVCSEYNAEKYAAMYVELDRHDGYVLALNPAQIFENVTY